MIEKQTMLIFKGQNFASVDIDTSVVLVLSERGSETRPNLSRYILQSIPPTSVTICSDEAHFHLSGMVNKQNFRYWSQNNPRELHQRPLHSPKVTVWCAMASFGVWGPYFFEEEGATVTVTSDRYCEMLERFLRPKVAQLLADYEPDDVWFQQDGATSHTSRRSLESCGICFQVVLFLCGVTLGGLHVYRI